jgi:hypothetical protein
MNSFVTESTRRLRDLSTLSLRYGLYRLSGHRLFAHDTHRFSQLSVVSPRLRRLEDDLVSSAYLQWFAKHLFENQGAVVDLGSCQLHHDSVGHGLVQNAG